MLSHLRMVLSIALETFFALHSFAFNSQKPNWVEMGDEEINSIILMLASVVVTYPSLKEV